MDSGVGVEVEVQKSLAVANAKNFSGRVELDESFDFWRCSCLGSCKYSSLKGPVYQL